MKVHICRWRDNKKVEFEPAVIQMGVPVKSFFPPHGHRNIGPVIATAQYRFSLISDTSTERLKLAC